MQIMIKIYHHNASVHHKHLVLDYAMVHYPSQMEIKIVEKVFPTSNYLFIVAGILK